MSSNRFEIICDSFHLIDDFMLTFVRFQVSKYTKQGKTRKSYLLIRFAVVREIQVESSRDIFLDLRQQSTS